MTEAFALVVEGLETLKDIENLPSEIIRSARIAVNDAATRGRTKFGAEILSQVNLPRDYVAPRNKRLYVSKKAGNSDLEAIITARSRPTSLARFAKGTLNKRPKQGVRVEVKPGAVRTIPGAFLIKLRSGSGLTDTQHNMGLALRTPDGRPPNRAYAPKPLGGNLWLLYGPSVAQALVSARGNSGVAVDLTPDVQQMLEDEFWRPMDLK